MVISTLNEYNGVLYPVYEQLPQSDVALNDNKKRSAGGISISNCLHASTAINKVNFLSNDPIEGRVLLAMSLSLLTGLIQILFSILHIGVFTKYLSDSVVNGFIIGAAYHVITSQLYTLLGLVPNDLHTPFIIIGVGFILLNFFAFSILILENKSSDPLKINRSFCIYFEI